MSPTCPAVSSGTMWGCWSRAANWISRRNRSRLTPAVSSGGSTLITTRRPRARSTAPKAPPPPPPADLALDLIGRVEGGAELGQQGGVGGGGHHWNVLRIRGGRVLQGGSMQPFRAWPRLYLESATGSFPMPLSPRSSRALAALALLALSAGRLTAQRLSDDREWELRCSRNWGDRDTERVCSITETTIAAPGGVLNVDGRTNGGVNVIGSGRRDILV